MIKKEAFLEAIIDGNKSIIIQALEEGINISFASEEQEDGRRPAIEFASFCDNYEILFILWLNKAVATTPYIESIFDKFKEGILPKDLVSDKKREKEKRNSKVKLDLTQDFSISKLQVLKGNILKEVDDSCELNIIFKPFKYEGKIFENELEFKMYNMIQIESNTEYLFTGNNEVCSSFYFDEVHNPVDLIKLKFGSIQRKKIEAEIDLFFDFEFEGTPFKNDSINLKMILNIVEE
jgi:hypothetical protein